ncbi:hypothetical protein MO973_37290, partial [Paenibacillus sp. TRM 82003]|nr:hypothetical protein [Paenibacillus sp. TRM 82003]
MPGGPGGDPHVVVVPAPALEPGARGGHVRSSGGAAPVAQRQRRAAPLPWPPAGTGPASAGPEGRRGGVSSPRRIATAAARRRRRRRAADVAGGGPERRCAARAEVAVAGAVVTPGTLGARDHGAHRPAAAPAG